MSFATELFPELDRAADIRPLPAFQEPGSTPQGARLRARYILAGATGASPFAVARLAGVPVRTVRGWAEGQTPSHAYRDTVDRVYRRFLRINNRARTEVMRSRSGRKAALAVGTSALKLTNDIGDLRYYKPSVRHWPAFISWWMRSNHARADDLWDEIVDDWDYPEPWGSDRIGAVDIV